jgi:hypothetical protein
MPIAKHKTGIRQGPYGPIIVDRSGRVRSLSSAVNIKAVMAGEMGKQLREKALVRLMSKVALFGLDGVPTEAPPQTPVSV